MVSDVNLLRLHIGSYAPKGEPGVHIYDFNPEDLKFTARSAYGGIESPSFLALNESGNRLYAISEIDGYEGGAGGPITMLDLDETGNLSYGNEQPSEGAWPCHAMVHRSGSLLVVSNYLGASVVMFELDEAGRLLRLADKITLHSGPRGGRRADRQQQAHPHAVFLSPDHRFVIVPDLGQDKILVYGIDETAKRLLPHDEVTLQASAGPRHFVFHPDLPYAYSVNELDSTVTGFHFEAEAGKFTPFQTISTWPDGYEGPSDCADIHISPDGRHLYASNRGLDSIAVFALDRTSGELQYVQDCPSGGQTPRNFSLSPDGRFLFAANQDSDVIQVFHRDPQTGMLREADASLSLYKPVCLLIREHGF